MRNDYNASTPAPTAASVPLAQDFIPEIYKCQPKSSTKCNITHMFAALTPENLPINATYIVENKGTMLYFSVFDCSAFYNCTFSPSGNHSARLLLEVAPVPQEEAAEMEEPVKGRAEEEAKALASDISLATPLETPEQDFQLPLAAEGREEVLAHEVS